MKARTQLWQLMREAQVLARALQDSTIALAARSLERAYRDRYGAYPPPEPCTDPDKMHGALD